MTDKIGGPAFPRPLKKYDSSLNEYYLDHENYPGMTLRDYFAAKAMQGIVGKDFSEAEFISKHSYKIADAMLKERDK